MKTMRCPHCGRLLKIKWEGAKARHICVYCDYEAETDGKVIV